MLLLPAGDQLNGGHTRMAAGPIARTGITERGTTTETDTEGTTGGRGTGTERIAPSPSAGVRGTSPAPARRPTDAAPSSRTPHGWGSARAPHALLRRLPAAPSTRGLPNTGAGSHTRPHAQPALQETLSAQAPQQPRAGRAAARRRCDRDARCLHRHAEGLTDHM